MFRKCQFFLITVGFYIVVVVMDGLCTSIEDLIDSADPNVCISMETVQENNNTVFYNITTIEVDGFCLHKLPFKCVKKIEQLDPMNIAKVIGRKYSMKAKCCNGYEPSLDGESSRPISNVPCVEGMCMKPNVCHCRKEYGGHFCNVQILCPLGTYGSKCLQKCQCLNNSTCDPVNGSCNCQAGYTGRYCENICTSGFYGINCKNKCQCEDGTICNPENGTCSCADGYTGKHCELSCPSGFYGKQCKLECNCQFNELCDPVNGSCKCQSGFFGTQCLTMHNFLNNIKSNKNHCNCNWYRTEYCDKITGQCRCKYHHDGICYCRSGWTGHDCKSMCPFNTYGLNCSSTCICHNGGMCRHYDGVCLCRKGFYGPTCSEVCPRNYYGRMCMHRCMCKTTAEICDPVRGCICDSSRPGNNCITALKLQPENELSNVLYDISIFLSTMVMSTILCAGMFLCYYFHCRHKKRERLIKNNFQLRKSITPELCRNHRSISTINGTMFYKHNNMRNHNNMFSTSKPMCYTNETFFMEYDPARFGYETNENIYFEIGESSLKPTEDLYDHLDFLRPTGSWKPHYQCTGGNNNTNTERNTTS